MVSVFVGKQDLRDLFGLVAKCLESVHIAVNILACKDRTVLIGNFFGCSGRQSGINKDNFIASVNQIVLQTAAIADILVIFIRAFLAAEYEWLRIESVFSEFN